MSKYDNVVYYVGVYENKKMIADDCISYLRARTISDSIVGNPDVVRKLYKSKFPNATIKVKKIITENNKVMKGLDSRLTNIALDYLERPGKYRTSVIDRFKNDKIVEIKFNLPKSIVDQICESILEIGVNDAFDKMCIYEMIRRDIIKFTKSDSFLNDVINQVFELAMNEDNKNDI